MLIGMRTPSTSRAPPQAPGTTVFPRWPHTTFPTPDKSRGNYGQIDRSMEEEMVRNEGHTEMDAVATVFIHYYWRVMFRPLFRECSCCRYDLVLGVPCFYTVWLLQKCELPKTTLIIDEIEKGKWFDAMLYTYCRSASCTSLTTSTTSPLCDLNPGQFHYSCTYPKTVNGYDKRVSRIKVKMMLCPNRSLRAFESTGMSAC